MVKISLLAAIAVVLMYFDFPIIPAFPWLKIDLRLLRRIVRDNRTRGYDVFNTIDNWQRVRRGEEKYIFPYIHQANVIINTALAYEVGVLKVYVEPLLLSVGVDSVYYEEARRLIDFLKQFFPIPGEYVTDDSILREFIGGKYND